jgi:hypothetical protein
MKRLTLAAAAAALLCLSLSGCVLDLNGPSEAGPRERSGPVTDGGDKTAKAEKIAVPAPGPKLDEDPQPTTPEPADSAPAIDKIKWELGKQTIKTAGVAKDTTATCTPNTISGKQDETIKCTVTYAGQQVPYSVNVDGGEYFVSYKYLPTKGVLLREVVLNEFGHSSYYDTARDPQCTVPEVALVDLDAPTGATCTYVTEYDDEEHIVDVRLGRYGVELNTR